MIGIIITPSASAAGERAELLERQHGDAVDEHADHDRRHAVERVGGEPDRVGQPRVRELGGVDARR